MEKPRLMASQVLTNIRKKVVAAMSDYALIAPDDKVMVAVSGGKDSSVLLFILEQIRRRAPYPYSLHPVILDQKQPGFEVKDYAAWVQGLGYELEVLEEDTYSVTVEKTEPGKAYCGLCSRQRRGILYNHAAKMGYQKIALGHHRDDANETLLMNLFFGGAIESMPPKFVSDDKRNTVIRPLYNVAEGDILSGAADLNVPIIPCRLCGSQPNLMRSKVKELLRSWSKLYPNLGASILAAQANVKPSHLADRDLFPFDQSNPRH